MPEFFLKLTFISLTCVTLFAFGARAWGNEQPPNPDLAGFSESCEGQTQPCWQGLVVGVTSVPEAQRILTSFGYTPSHRSSYGIITFERIPNQIQCDIQVSYTDSTGPIQLLIFENCDGLQFGDFENWLGTPESLMPEQDANNLIYDGGKTIVLISPSLSPVSPVLQLRMRPDTNLLYDVRIDWKGYLLQPWYCVIQANKYGVKNC